MQVQCKKTKRIMSVIPISNNGRMSFQDIVTKDAYNWEDLEPARAIAQAGASSTSANAVVARVGVAVTGVMA